MRIQQPTGTGTADAVLIEGDIDIAAATASFFRWYMNILGNTSTASDTMNIFEIQSAAGTDTWGCVGLRVSAASTAIELGVGRSVPTSFATFTLPTNSWHCIEVRATTAADSDTADGGVTLFVDGVQLVAVTSLDQDTIIGRGVLGLQDQLLTTEMTILIDEFAQDDARLYPFVKQFPEVMRMTKSGHAFVGRGMVENVTLISGATATDCQVSVFDSGYGITNDASNIGVLLKNVTADEIVDPAGMPIECYEGCYVALTGTQPSALIKVSRMQAFTPATVRHWGANVKRNPLQVP